MEVCKVIEKKSSFFVHGAAVFFLVAGLAYSFYLGNELRYPDERQYFAIAKNLVNGLGYTMDGQNPTALRTPGYPLFLAFFIKLGASVIFLRWLNFVALALCVYLVRSILRRFDAGPGAAISALYLIGYAVLFYTAGTLYSQTLFTLLLLCIVRITADRDLSGFEAVLFGLFSGLIILVHPTAIFIPPLIFFWIFRPGRWRIIPKVALSALIAAACLSIWAYRNYKVFDAFVPISTHGGDTLYIGNNE